MILMIDNYDSFTYNLVQYLKMLGSEVKVARNDEITLDEIIKLDPECIFISPGPCTPNESGISLLAVEKLSGIIPIMGICLGHQTIAQVFGANVVKAIRPVHGKVHKIYHSSKGCFEGLPNPISVTRYHSLVVERDSLPDEFEITAMTNEGEIMGIKHKTLPVEGLQFHPEAILTEYGMEMLETFLEYSRKWRDGNAK